MNRGTTDEQDTRIGTVLLGRYQLEALLGRGRMGCVFRAIQQPNGRTVAVRLLSTSTAAHPELAARFWREAQVLARLRHPNTVRLYDFGTTDDDQLFIVMELLEGSDLGRYMQACAPIPVLEAIQITRDALGSLEDAHAQGIVHRDIKPRNIFLSRMHDGTRVARLTDFAIAQLAPTASSSKLTASGEIFGTPAYMSPEQAMGNPPDASSDVYSLGVTLFQMITGRIPFDGDSPASQLMAHVTAPVPRLSDVRPERAFSPEVQGLLDGWLNKVPKHRPQSARDALRSIEMLFESERHTRTRDEPLSAWQPKAAAPTSAISQPVARSSGTMLATQAVSTAGLARPRRWLRPLLSVVALLGGGLVFWITFRPTSAERSRTSQPAVPSQGEPVGKLPAVDLSALIAREKAPKPVQEIIVRSIPSQAKVLKDGRELGKTPYTLQVDEPTRITLKLAEHVPYELALSQDSRSDLTVKLQPIGAPAPTPPPLQRRADSTGLSRKTSGTQLTGY